MLTEIMHAGARRHQETADLDAVVPTEVLTDTLVPPPNAKARVDIAETTLRASGGQPAVPHSHPHRIGDPTDAGTQPRELDLGILTDAGITLAPPPGAKDRVRVAEKTLRASGGKPALPQQSDSNSVVRRMLGQR